MSWRVDQHGTVETDEGDVFTEDTGRHGLKLPRCYRPVVGGVRHRTRYRARPPSGELVTTLCGVLHKVSARGRKLPCVYACHACDEIAETEARANYTLR
ncbi:hypothetical protein [Amycolatopsis anabasis]|uniref:hypothetical protein n=1 Tax=Amycolatopsis anabasis TaxID=1840409 RepID=UPI00131E9840|nr:hypothetical protein [Amycolatopsis anabasis]